MKKWIVMMLCAAFVLVSVNAEPADSAAAEKNEAAAEQAEAKTDQQATAVKDGESKETLTNWKKPGKRCNTDWNPKYLK